MDTGILSREDSKILRGLAILPIMLHNFLHLPRFGFSAENEMSFQAEKTLSYFSALSNGHPLIESLSFLGWIGVPVFIFLTGYGTVISSQNRSKQISTGQYVKNQWWKLSLLLLPALCFFAGLDVLHHDIWPQLAKRLSYVTLLTNFGYPWLNCNPGVYWYFGLTFQLYVLWAFCKNKMAGRNLFWGSVLSLLGLFLLSLMGESDALSVYRHCFTGWFPIFAIGVWFAQSGKRLEMRYPWWVELLVAAVLLCLLPLMNRWLVTWLFVPIFALFFFLVLGELTRRLHAFAKLFRWIGDLSAALFVSHPIARYLTLARVVQRVDSIWLMTLLYLVISFIIAIVYGWAYKRMRAFIIKTKHVSN